MNLNTENSSSHMFSIQSETARTIFSKEHWVNISIFRCAKMSETKRTLLHKDILLAQKGVTFLFYFYLTKEIKDQTHPFIHS